MENDRIIRCITTDGSVMIAAIDSGNLVHTAQCIHKTTPVATAALGRLLTASSIMGAMLKQTDATITLKVNGGGALGNVVALADSNGNCRGYVDHPGVDLPIRDDGKLDVSGAVGTDGMLYVMRDSGEGQPYVGQIALETGEIAEDIAAYYAKSEQIPTVCGLGVLLDKEDHKVLLAGGFLMQALPGADNDALGRLEQNVLHLEPMTTMLAKGMSIEEICRKALDGFEMEILDEFSVSYVCTCSKERVERALTTLKPEEIRSLPNESGHMDAVCQYCQRSYRFTSEDLEELAQSVENAHKEE